MSKMALNVCYGTLIVLLSVPWASAYRRQSSLICNEKCSNDEDSECRLSTTCPRCQNSALVCYPKKAVDDAFKGDFKDSFCGPQGVVVVNTPPSSVEIYKLFPRQCDSGKCPDDSTCVTNPGDNKRYCCARVPEEDTSPSVRDPFTKQPVSSVRPTIFGELVGPAAGAINHQSPKIIKFKGSPTTPNVKKVGSTPVTEALTGIFSSTETVTAFPSTSETVFPTESTQTDVVNTTTPPTTFNTTTPPTTFNTKTPPTAFNATTPPTTFNTTTPPTTTERGVETDIVNSTVPSTTNRNTTQQSSVSFSETPAMKRKTSLTVNDTITSPIPPFITAISNTTQAPECTCDIKKNRTTTKATTKNAQSTITTTSNSKTTKTMSDATAINTPTTSPSISVNTTLNTTTARIMSARTTNNTTITTPVPPSTVSTTNTPASTEITQTATTNQASPLNTTNNTTTTTSSNDVNMLNPTSTMQSTSLNTTIGQTTTTARADETIKNTTLITETTAQMETTRSSNATQSPTTETPRPPTSTSTTVLPPTSLPSTSKTTTLVTPAPTIHARIVRNIEDKITNRRCQEVKLLSRVNRRDEKTIVDGDATGIKVVSMYVVETYPNSATCSPGVSYGFSGATVYSEAACRAKFIVCYDINKEAQLTTKTPGSGQVKCQKYVIVDDTRQTVFNSNKQPAKIVSMTITLRISYEKCLESVNYFYEGPTFVVNNDCKAAFNICYVDVGSTAAPLTITSEPGQSCVEVNLFSRLNRPAEKTITDENGNAVTISSMTLVLQHSEIDCVRGNTFSFSGSVATSKDGCRGRFRICYNGEGQFTTAPPRPGQKCQIANLLSRLNRPAVKRVTDENGNAVTIRSMTLVSQESDIDCVRGETFSFSGSVATSRKGCRGKFQICYDDEGQFTTKPPGPICENALLRSEKNQPDVKKIRDANNNEVQIVSMDLVRQLSDVHCIEWYTYFFKGCKVVARRGCKAVFKVCYEGEMGTTAAPLTNTPEPGESCVAVNLFSRVNRPAEKTITDENGNAVTISSMTLVLQHSEVDCVRGNTFSFSGSVATSKDGCRGRFRICYNGEGQLTTAPPRPGQKCQRVNLFSRLNRPAIKRITDESGNAVAIGSMTLVSQESDIDCIRGETFSFRGSVATSRKGCRGNFQICYDDEEQLTTKPAGPVCETVLLRSEKNQPDVKKIRDANNNEVQIVSMDLVRQLSDVHCIEWYTYFFKGCKVVARRGCKAVFKVCYEGEMGTTAAPLTNTPEPGESCIRVNLFSRVNRPAVKRITDENGNTVTIRSMTLVLQHSDIDCVQGSTFGFARSVATSRNGCRGSFRICFDDELQLTTKPSGPVCQSVVLRSEKNQPDVRKIRDVNNNEVQIVSMDLVRQLSDVHCIEWYTYFFKGCKVVARNGCKAVFKVCYEGEMGTTAAPLTNTPEPGESCVRVNLFSRVNRPAVKRVTDENGNTVTIRSMTLVLQYSDIDCVQGSTFGFSRSVATSRNGCRGSFRICFDDESQLTTKPSGPVCESVLLRSEKNQPDIKKIRDANNNEVQIVSMDLVRQLSDVHCIEWYTYFFKGCKVVARNGCKAVFKVCYEGEMGTTAAPLTNTPEPGESCLRVNLFSRVNRPAVKRITDENGNAVTIRSMTLVLQHSDIDCVQGSTFGFTRSVATSRNGCRGSFRICFDDESQLTTKPNGPVCENVVLRSELNQPDAKKIRDANNNPVQVVSMDVVRQLSDVHCIEWYTYFFKGCSIVARRGCKAVFKVCYEGEMVTTLAPLTNTPEPGESCIRVNLFSRINSPAVKRITDENGNTVTIISMTLVLQYSDIDCVQGSTFGFTRSVATSRNGCRGSFRICFDDEGQLTTKPSGPICQNVVLRSEKNQPDAKKIRGDSNNPVQVVSMDVVRQLSDVHCIEWYTYFFKGCSVVARSGCKAVFKVCYEGEMATTIAPLTNTPEPGESCTRVNLFSRINRPAVKRITDENGNAVTIRSMTLVLQHSDIDCVQGSTFGFTRSVATSRNGCRGSFRICFDDEGQLTTKPSGPVCQSVVLRSEKNQPDARKIRDANDNPVQIVSMDLVRQLSDVHCIEWYTYFFKGCKVVARSGCKAVFKVCYEGEMVTTLAPLTNTPEPGESCIRVNLFSRINRPAAKRITDENENAVTIRSMTLVLQYSDIDCVQGSTFGFARSVATSRSGCRGSFRICFDDEGQLTTKPSGPVCENVVLRSEKNQPDARKIRDANNNPVQVVSMDVVRQLSDVHCIEWYTYFFKGCSVVAKGGCKAVFKVCYEGEMGTTAAPLTNTPEPGESCIRVNLFSRLNRPAVKRVTDENGNTVTIRSMTLVLQYSDIDCVQGSTFGFTRSVATSRNGCRGSFRICFDDEGQLTTKPSGPVCENVVLRSEKNQPDARKIRDANNNPVQVVSMDVVRQLSDVHCIEWYTYFFKGCSVVAKGGCKAVFKVCYEGEMGTTAAPLTNTPEPGESCVRVNLFSRLNRPAVKRVTDENGNTVTIRSMTLVLQYSDIDCVQGSTFGFTRSVATSRNGCRGSFRICFDDEGQLTTKPSGPVCQSVVLRSEKNQPDAQKIRDANNNEVQIVSMDLVRQLSDVHCIEWYTYFFKGCSAVARGGCKAVFKVCYEGEMATTLAPLTNTPEPGESCIRVNLFSRVNRPAVKRITDENGNTVTIRSMTLVLQHSDVDCVQGSTFGFTRSVATSRNGCRGSFRICFDDEAQLTTKPSGPVCQSVILRSEKNQPDIKKIRDANNNEVQIVSMDLVRQLSDVHCVEWYTYFFKGCKVVARRGCKAVFKVCYEGEMGTTAAPLTNTPAPGETCVSVNLFSRLNRPAEKTIRDENGNQVDIRSMTLVTQESEIDCVRGNTFSFSGSVATSNGGCRGSFRVCYEDTLPLTDAPDPGQSCLSVNLFSRLNRPAEKTIRDGNGNEVAISSMTLVLQHSEIDCVRGNTFSFSGSVATSRSGCRGKFRICYNDEGQLTTKGNGANCESVLLRSTLQQPDIKRIVDGNNRPAKVVSMDLVKQISGIQCVEWISYFFSGSKVVARGGCKGLFKVCYEAEMTTTAAPLTEAPDQVQCVKVQIKSQPDAPETRHIMDDNGGQVHIIRVIVVKQLSHVQCVEWDNFYFGDSAVYVLKGCHAVFTVCYFKK